MGESVSSGVGAEELAESDYTSASWTVMAAAAEWAILLAVALGSVIGVLLVRRRKSGNGHP
ncbi:MAG: hypothetical protein LUD01_07600 [Clostridiales bacterium]|nr:hypothetical protein [Clostridiales bacterium]